MKVLKEGKPWSISVQCTGSGNGDGGCGAKLSVEEGDLYITQSHHYDGSSETYVTFQCCACKAETDIAERRIPARVYMALPSKKTWMGRRA